MEYTLEELDGMPLKQLRKLFADGKIEPYQFGYAVFGKKK